jgi:hypothetical protein
MKTFGRAELVVVTDPSGPTNKDLRYSLSLCLSEGSDFSIPLTHTRRFST